MDISDFLKKTEFKELDLFLTREMYKHAGNDLTSKMEDLLGTKKNARDWFYSHSPVLNGKRPYDYCKNGKISEVKDLLGRIEYGIFS